LREHRVRARVSLEDIMTETKISRRFLEAIEEGRYEDLPGGVFAVSYIRQYAWMTGYDAELILDHYRSRMEQRTQAEPRRRQPAARWVRFFESA
jgi:cytoskeletal protein RodZ